MPKRAERACNSVAHKPEQCEAQEAGWRQQSRRCLLAQVPLLASIGVLAPRAARAFETAPQGYARHSDRLDGYSFVYPDPWIPVTTSGNDVFYRNPRVPDENVFVDISSPSSSNYASVEDLGPPQVAQQRLLTQFANEYMSTRIGITREIEPLFAESRKGATACTKSAVCSRAVTWGARRSRSRCVRLEVCRR